MPASKIAFFVTSHGFGHLNRAVTVVNKIPPRVPVVIRSDPNLFLHWRERLTRPAEMMAHVSDAGAVNPPGNSTFTDGPATLALAEEVHRQALARVDDDVRWLREERIAAILCDAPAVPLLAAHRAGIPGFWLGNFTWADIYAPYERAAAGRGARAGGSRPNGLAAELKRYYRLAAVAFRCEPALSMSWLPRQRNVGLVTNSGRNRRKELQRLLGLDSAEKLVYFYVGRYGQDDLDWDRLEKLAARGVHFVGYHAAPVGPLRNLHLLSPSEWPGGDVIASTDALVAKAGYGTVAEAMALGTPMIYPPRRGFSEFRALDRALRSWGGGIPVSSREFSGLRLERALETAFRLGPLAPPYPTDGADRVAAHLAGISAPSSVSGTGRLTARSG